MSISAWMLTGLLIGAAPTSPADSTPVPKLDKGLEITWRGSFSEAILRTNVRAYRAYDVETRAFVLDVSPLGADIAYFTSIKHRPDVKVTPEAPPIIRIELLRIDPQGKPSLLPPDALILPPDQRKLLPLPLMTLEGLPTFDASLFTPLPREKKLAGAGWEVPEDKRPALKLRLEGIDSVAGARCFKITGMQQTDDWDALRIQRPAWRRGETVWISAYNGCTSRLERVIEKRDPQSGEIGFRSKLVMEQAGRMNYPGRLGEDRREELVAALQFLAELERLLPEAGRIGSQPFDELLRKVERHNATHFTGDTLPYRAAILLVKRKAEAAKRGHIPPSELPPESAEPSTLTLNRIAADIAAIDLSNGESIKLSKLRGRPVVLIYYQPGSAKTAEPVLRFAQNLYTRNGPNAFILPLAIGVSEDAIRQRNDLKLTVHILAGRDVYRTHGIESTPSFIVIDSTGVVRRIVTGWSEENAETIRTELEKLVK